VANGEELNFRLWWISRHSGSRAKITITADRTHFSMVSAEELPQLVV
jgi:hypothetical protein